MAEKKPRFEQYLDNIPDWKKKQQGKHTKKMKEQGGEPAKPSVVKQNPPKKPPKKSK
jgi:hypothetical protein